MHLVEPRGWVLYDDSCGFCRKWVPFWGPTLQRRGYEFESLQSGWIRDRLKLPPGELLHDLRLLLPDGTQFAGAEVYRQVMRRIWWAYPLYLFSITPGLRSVFNWGYRTFADNRYLVSAACRLPPGPESRGRG